MPTTIDETDAHADLISSVLEARVADRDRRQLDVTLIRPGTSANGLNYAEDVLRASLPLWEGAAAFLDHPTALDLTRAGQRSLRDLVGVYGDVRYDDGIRATLTFYPTAAWAYELAASAIADRAAGRPVADLGVSADMRVQRRANVAAAAKWDVTAITKVVSADLVFQPSAGGSLDRVLEARPSNQGTREGGTDMSDHATTTIPEGTTQASEPTTQSDAVQALEARGEAVLASLEEARRATCAELLRLKLSASELPEAACLALGHEFADRVFEAEELDRRIDSMRSMLGAIFGGQAVKGAGALPQPNVRAGLGSLDRLQIALDRLFGVAIPDAYSDLPRLSGIREAYLAYTGDRHFTGQYQWDESVVREANEVTTSVLTNALANSMTRRIVADYQTQPKWWQPIVVKASIGDFKQQQRIHLNDFAALSTVAENAAYTNLAWGDVRETYSPAKRGNLVVVTLESIVNDDTQAITRIPRKLAAAGVATVNEFVAGLFTANSGAGSAMADTYNVFDATNHQGNAGTAALSATTLQTALIALLKMTNSAGKRLGLVGRYLLTPPDLFFTARTILESVNVPGSANNDVNPVRGALTPISVPNWTDTNNWYVLAEPAQIEMLELGFLNGREEPELIVQDSPSAGSVFTNDAISWKVRHVFGGVWLDYRGGYGAIVA